MPASHASRRLAAIAVPAAVALVVGLVGALPSAAATGPHSETGTAAFPSPVGFGATDLGFTLTCPVVDTDTQGLDGYVFALPAGVAVAGATAVITADSGGPTDVSAYTYDDSCGYLDTYSSAGELTFTLGETDRYLSVFTTVLPDAVFTLTVTPPTVVDPSPSATATGSASATPTATPVMARGDYDLTPTDPLYAEEAPLLGAVPFSVGTGQWGMQRIRAAEAWQKKATGAGIQVGVLDSGLDLGHPDLNCDPAKVRVADGATQASAPGNGQPQDVDGHGTHVAGIIGACTNNGVGVVGVAPDATLVPFQVLGAEGGTADDLVAGIRAATAAGVHVINMSIGFGVGAVVTTVPGSGSAVALAGAFSEVDDAIADAVKAGVVVVAAAGNESTPLCGYPALADGVVCVGSTDRRDLPAWYGNFPVKADGGVPTQGAALTAPGGSGQVFCDLSSEKVLSTYARDLDSCDEGAGVGYEGLDGTSMASPHVAGVAALVYDRLGGVRDPATASKVIEAMKAGAVDLGTPGYDPVFGSGRIDALGAVNAVTAVTPTATATPSATATATATATPTVKGTEMSLTAPASAQRTDDYTFSAVLTSEGAPLAGRTVRLAVTGQSQKDLVTDASGRVSWTFPVELDPGSYEVKATYAGSQTERASGEHQAVDVLAEDTVMTLTSSGSNGQRTLAARVADADTTTSGVGGVPVTFYADGVQVGTATTAADGTATHEPAKSARGAKSYEARFAGDSRWRSSSTTIPG